MNNEKVAMPCVMLEGDVHVLMKAGMEENAAPIPPGAAKKSVPARRKVTKKGMRTEG